MEYKYQKQTEKTWINEKNEPCHVNYLPGYKKLMDRKCVSLAKVGIDLEKRNIAFKAAIEEMVEAVKLAMVKDFPAGPPTIRTFYSYDHSVKIEVQQGSSYTFNEDAFNEAKDSFREYLKADTGDTNVVIKEALGKVFTEDQGSKRDIDLISDFSKKFVDSLKDNEHFQAGIKSMKGIYESKERLYYKVSVMTEAGEYKKVSLNINELA